MNPKSPTRETPPPLTEWGARKHVLDTDDFSRHEIDLVLDTAETMLSILNRDIKKVPSLRGKVVLTLFNEASTRTRVSFEQAAKMLSADVINITPTSSSAEKGESLLNTVLTLQAMHADVLVMRDSASGSPYFAARNLTNMKVVNAGDGQHAHPTQALLDAFTIKKHLGNLEGTKIVMVGDILHSRVARSNIWALSTLGANVVLSGPPTLLPKEPISIQSPNGDISADGEPIDVCIETNLDDAIKDADVVIALRLQKERQAKGMIPSLREYTRRWLITDSRLNKAKSEVLLMHPGPLNEGVEISSSLAHGLSSRVEEQVTNGVAIRMALLYLLLTGAPIKES